MIKTRTPLSMPEALEYINSEKNKELKSFIKKFHKFDENKAKELRNKLEKLDLIKLNEKHISKLIDFLPKTKEELNKTVTDAGLNEEESNNVLQTIKEFK